MTRQQLNDEEIKVAIAARFGCRSEDVILVARPVKGFMGRYIGEKIYASVPVKDEMDTMKERINEAFKKIAQECIKDLPCDENDPCCECDRCEICDERAAHAEGMADAAAIFADTLGIEVIEI